MFKSFKQFVGTQADTVKGAAGSAVDKAADVMWDSTKKSLTTAGKAVLAGTVAVVVTTTVVVVKSVVTGSVTPE